MVRDVKPRIDKEVELPTLVTLTFSAIVEGGGTQNDSYMDTIWIMKKLLADADSTDDVIGVFDTVSRVDVGKWLEK